MKWIISELFYFCNDQFFFYLTKWFFQSNFSFFHNDSYLSNFLLKTLFQIFTSSMSNFGVFDLQLEIFKIIISDFYYFHYEQSNKISQQICLCLYCDWIWYLFFLFQINLIQLVKEELDSSVAASGSFFICSMQIITVSILLPLWCILSILCNLQSLKLWYNIWCWY